MAAGDQAEARKLIEFAAKAGETFVSAYYAASDSPQRVQLIPTLYLATSSVVWNGNPVSGASDLALLLNTMPGSKHELHGFDCHPLGGGTIEGTFQAPSLLITATGVVAHHTPSSLSAMPPSNAPASSTSSSRRGVPAGGSDPSVPIDSLPRAFSQNFVLVNDPQGEGGVNCSAGDEKPIVGKYFIQADTLRFVG